MSTATADLLAQIAEHFGVPPGMFEAPRLEAQVGEALGMALVLDLLADPQGARIARAFADVADPATRRMIADTVAAIAGASNLKRAMRA